MDRLNDKLKRQQDKPEAYPDAPELPGPRLFTAQEEDDTEEYQ
jgi:hypothetical protein